MQLLQNFLSVLKVLRRLIPYTNTACSSINECFNSMPTIEVRFIIMPFLKHSDILCVFMVIYFFLHLLSGEREKQICFTLIYTTSRPLFSIFADISSEHDIFYDIET